MNNIEIPSFINEIMCDFEEKEIKDKNIRGFYNLLKKHYYNYQLYREEDYEFLGNYDDIKVLFLDFEYNEKISNLPKSLEILIVERNRYELNNLPSNLKYIICPQKSEVDNNNLIRIDLETLYNILY